MTTTEIEKKLEELRKIPNPPLVTQIMIKGLEDQLKAKK